MTQIRINSYDGIRFFAFIPIFLLHAGAGSMWHQPTMWSLSLFFMLSGLASTLARQSDNQQHTPSLITDTVCFTWKKIKTFYPLHLVGFILCALLILLAPNIYTFSSLSDMSDLALRNLTLIQAWWIELSVKFSFNGVSWFLSSLLFCFMLTPLLLRVINRTSVTQILIWQAVFISLTFIPNLLIESSQERHLWSNWPPLRFMEYGVGICVGLLMRHEKVLNYCANSGSRHYWKVIEFLILLLNALAVYYADLIPRTFWLPLIAAFLFVITLESSLLRRLLSLHIATSLGATVMVLFLTHNIILKYLNLFSYHFYSLPKWYHILLGAIISLAVAITLTKYLSRKKKQRGR